MKLTKKMAIREINKYRSLMNLEEYDFKVNWIDKKTYYADVNADPNYLKVEIGINLGKHSNIQELRRTIIHEMLHVFLCPFTQLAKSLSNKKVSKALHAAEETLATRFERWDVWQPATSPPEDDK